MPESYRCRAHRKTVVAVGEIGIYRCAAAEHIRRMDDRENAIPTECQASEYVTNVQLAHFGTKYWTAWRYNEVIAWLRLYAYPLQGSMQHPLICGEFWAVDARRITASLARKRYIFDGEAFAIVVDEAVITAGVFNHTTEQIERWARSPRLKRHVVDLEVWNGIGPHIDWRSMLRLS
jgi:hypothetical protein